MEYIPCNLCSQDDFEVIYEPAYELEEDKDFTKKFRSSGSETLIYQLVKCRNCGLMYVNPRPEASSILKAYEDGNDEVFMSQAGAREATFKRSLGILEKHITQKGKILDIGTAGGSFLAVAKRKGWQVYGCEPNKWMCEWAGKYYGIEVKQGDVFAQNYPSHFFDVITLWDVLEHTPDPKCVLKECNRILKDGGLLIVNYPDISSWIAKSMGRKWVFLLSVHLYYFAPKTVEKMLKCCGFEISGIKPYFQELYLEYIFKRAKAYSYYLGNFCERFSSILGIGKLRIPYWMGQTLVIAKKSK